MSREALVYSTLVHKALDFAAVVHARQFRKDRHRNIPYVSHAAMVAHILEKSGFDADIVAAGALHDTLEDTYATREMLEREFGPRVAELVDNVTEQDKSLPWEERKARYHERLRTAPFEALAISCADKTHNLWSLVLYHRAGHDVWDIVKRGRDAQISRMEKMAELYRERLNHPIRGLFEQALAVLKKEC
ncbi:MAG: HD domain-containing protein [Planctomycetota bacterium]